MTGRSATEKEAILMLPPRLSGAVSRTLAFHSGRLCEIRLRVGGPFTVTVDGNEFRTGAVCSSDDVEYVIRSLTGNSLYSHAETIREGYICSAGGIRAGICGKAVTRDGRIDTVTSVSSLNVRIPHRVPGASERVFKLISKLSPPFGVLIYSKPGVGKTTLLRELIPLLSTGDGARRLSVVDTRFELAAGLDCGDLLADFLSGYPREKGIEIATRTLSPELIVCDEISSRSDAEAILTAASSGVSVIASCHGTTLSEIKRKQPVASLIFAGAFDLFVGLSGRDPDGSGYLLDVDVKAAS
ncbi:MAG: hypothetical protein IJK58_09765 [Clostridia bacterium]|nr:hypothetical protein [Clostridia bacterium]